MFKKKDKSTNLLRISPTSGAGDGHYFIVAPAGSGKTGSFVIPNALSYNEGSLVVLDVKGEIYAVTASERKRKGNKVYFLNPEDKNSNRVDPLSILNPESPTFMSDIKNGPVEWLLTKPPENAGGDAGSFFYKMINKLLWTIIAFELAFWNYQEKKLGIKRPTLYEIASRVLMNPSQLLEYLQNIADITKENNSIGPDTQQINKMAMSFFGADVERTWPNIVISLHADLSWMADSQIISVLSGDCTEIPEDKRVNGDVFKVDEVLNGNTSIYMCLPIKMLTATPALAKVVTGALISKILDAKGNINGKALFILDEAQTLGNMQIIHDEGINQGRGYGIRLCLIIQTPAAFKAKAGDARFEAWNSGCSMKMFFGVGSADVAKIFSEELGKATIVNTVFKANRQADGSLIVQQENNLQERQLLTTDEIIGMKRGYAVAKLRGNHPILVKLPYYKAIPELMAMADPNPYDNIVYTPEPEITDKDKQMSDVYKNIEEGKFTDGSLVFGLADGSRSLEFENMGERMEKLKNIVLIETSDEGTPTNFGPEPEVIDFDEEDRKARAIIEQAEADIQAGLLNMVKANIAEEAEASSAEGEDADSALADGVIDPDAGSDTDEDGVPTGLDESQDADDNTPEIGAEAFEDNDYTYSESDFVDVVDYSDISPADLEEIDITNDEDMLIQAAFEQSK